MKLIRELLDISEMVEIKEGAIPWHVTMTLQQVVDAGKITDSIQTFLIASLVNLFKNGGPDRWPRDLNPYGSEADSERIEAIKSLDEHEQETLAKWLLTALQTPGNYEDRTCPFRSPEAATVDWVRWVTRKKQ